MRELLVLDADGARLRGAVARKRGGVRLHAFTECAGSMHDVTLDTLLAQLQRRAPRRAVLVADAAVATAHGTAGAPAKSAPSDCACGWTSPVAGFRMVAAVTRSFRDAWARRLSSRGIRLVGIYPRIASVVAAPEASKVKERAIVHIHGATLGCFHVRDGAVRYARILALAEGTGLEDACAATDALLPRGEIFVCGAGAAAAQLASRLSSVRDAILFDPSPVAPGGNWAPLLGAARHALGAAPADSVARIPAAEAERRVPSPLRWLVARAAGH
jgi:hypothetical protein